MYDEYENEEISPATVIFKEGKQVGYNKAIDDFKKEIVDMVNNSPTVENDYGEIRPMNIEEICEIIVDKLTSKQGDEKNND